MNDYVLDRISSAIQEAMNGDLGELHQALHFVEILRADKWIELKLKEENDMDRTKSLREQTESMAVGKSSLLKMLDCLIDTAERTTELSVVYNDKDGSAVHWIEVYAIRKELER